MRGSGLKNSNAQCATNVSLQLLRSISVIGNAVKNVVKKLIEPDKCKSTKGDISPLKIMEA